MDVALWRGLSLLRGTGYPITIASGLFNEPASFLPLKSGEQVMLVTNETLAPLYLDKVRGVLNRRVLTSIALSSLTASSIKAWRDSIPSLRRCYKPHGRDTTLVALGGGVVAI
ncbi:hypothetical protein ACLK1V_18435 [Escherichia coli]